METQRRPIITPGPFIKWHSFDANVCKMFNGKSDSIFFLAFVVAFQNYTNLPLKCPLKPVRCYNRSPFRIYWKIFVVKKTIMRIVPQTTGAISAYYFALVMFTEVRVYSPTYGLYNVLLTHPVVPIGRKCIVHDAAKFNNFQYTNSCFF